MSSLRVALLRLMLRVHGILLPALALCALALPSSAQTHLGREFWLADTFSTATTFTIVIANPSSSTTANISIVNIIEGTTLDTVLPCSTKTFSFADHELGVQGTAISANPTYHIVSDIDIAVFIFDPLANAAFNDACLALPVQTLGTRHRIANFVNPDNSSGQFVGVVAIIAGGVTNVQIIDDTQTVVNNVNLQQGEYFQRINSINVGALPSDDMTGWEVVADQPVAVFSGSNGTAVGTPGCCADILLEQLLPASKLTLGYAVAPARTRPLGCTIPSTCSADVFRFVATQNSTTFTTIPNVGGGVFNEADYLQIATSTPFIIKGDKPFFGYQYLASGDAVYGSNPSSGTGDPALIDIIPVEQFRLDYIVYVESTFVDNFLNITAPVGSSLFLNNNPITAPCDLIGTLNGTTYCSIRLPVASGTHKVTSTNNKFGLTVSGFHFYSSYAYPAGLGSTCLLGKDGWMRDVPTDNGTEPNPSTANMWESPDIWVRNNQDTNLQFAHQHENPIFNAVNYVYVKVRNRGCEPLTVGNLVTHYAKASTGLAWPANWVGNPPNGDVIGTQPVNFIPSNGEIIKEYAWTPSATGHFCLLARLVSTDDPMTFAEGSSVHTNTKNNNNIVWKNVNVVGGDPMGPSNPTDIEVIVRNVELTAVDVDVELGDAGAPIRSSFLQNGTIELTLPQPMFDAWQMAGGGSTGLSLLPGTTTFQVMTTFAELTGIPMAVGEEHPVVLTFQHSGAATTTGLRNRLSPLDPYVIRQRSNGSATPDGGVTFIFPWIRSREPIPR